MTENTNPAARDPEDVLGTNLPDTISAVCWLRPFNYVIVRTDDDRLSHFDDHPEGRIICSHVTRHNAAGNLAKIKRRSDSGEYIISPQRNESYEQGPHPAYDTTTEQPDQ